MLHFKCSISNFWQEGRRGRKKKVFRYMPETKEKEKNPIKVISRRIIFCVWWKADCRPSKAKNEKQFLLGFFANSNLMRRSKKSFTGSDFVYNAESLFTHAPTQFKVHETPELEVLNWCNWSNWNHPETGICVATELFSCRASKNRQKAPCQRVP